MVLLLSLIQDHSNLEILKSYQLWLLGICWLYWLGFVVLVNSHAHSNKCGFCEIMEFPIRGNLGSKMGFIIKLAIDALEFKNQ